MKEAETLAGLPGASESCGVSANGCWGFVIHLSSLGGDRVIHMKKSIITYFGVLAALDPAEKEGLLCKVQMCGCHRYIFSPSSSMNCSNEVNRGTEVPRCKKLLLMQK